MAHLEERGALHRLYLRTESLSALNLPFILRHGLDGQPAGNGKPSEKRFRTDKNHIRGLPVTFFDYIERSSGRRTVESSRYAGIYYIVILITRSEHFIHLRLGCRGPHPREDNPCIRSCFPAGPEAGFGLRLLSCNKKNLHNANFTNIIRKLHFII